jgi:hypothetical protein
MGIPFNYLGPVGVVSLPVVASRSRPRLTTRRLATIPQGSAPSDAYTLTDHDGNAVDLLGRTLRMVVARATDEGDEDDRTDDAIEALYKYETGDGLTIGGASHNVLTIQHDAANTATAGRFRYWLFDVSVSAQPVALMRGTVDVEPAAVNV